MRKLNDPSQRQYASLFQFWEGPRHFPIVAEFALSVVNTAEKFQVSSYSFREWGAVLLGPHFEVGDSHPTQELPAGQVNHCKIGLEEDQWQDEESKPSADQEKEKNEHLVGVAEFIVIGGLPNQDLATDHQPSHQLSKLELEEPEEPKSVALAYAVPNPGAMVIVGCYTLLASFAMLAPERLLDMAD